MTPSHHFPYRISLVFIDIGSLLANRFIKGFRLPEISKASPGPGKRRQSNRGFALLTALLAIWILTGLGVFVVMVSTRDVRVSTRIVGEKKAFASAEAGIHRLAQNFDPFNMEASTLTNVPVYSSGDPDSRYSIDTPTRPQSGPATVPLPGYAMGGGQMWGQDRYVTRVTGTNSRYASSVTIDVGIGFGPVEITTGYR